MHQRRDHEYAHKMISYASFPLGLRVRGFGSAGTGAERNGAVKGRLGMGSLRAEVRRRCMRIVRYGETEIPKNWGDLGGPYWLALNEREGLVWRFPLRHDGSGGDEEGYLK